MDVRIVAGVMDGERRTGPRRQPAARPARESHGRGARNRRIIGSMSFDGAEHATDEALLKRLARGDEAAARELTRRLTPRALALATRMLRDPAEAEDVAQEAMMRLWRAAPEWRAGEAKPSTWLHRVTSNLCIDRLRKARRAGPPLEDVAEPHDPQPGMEARMAAADRAAIVKEGLARLPERQRQAVTLRHLEGLGNPEIAEALGVTVEAVESLLTRGRRALAAFAASAEAAPVGADAPETGASAKSGRAQRRGKGAVR